MENKEQFARVKTNSYLSSKPKTLTKTREREREIYSIKPLSLLQMASDRSGHEKLLTQEGNKKQKIKQKKIL